MFVATTTAVSLAVLAPGGALLKNIIAVAADYQFDAVFLLSKSRT